MDLAQNRNSKRELTCEQYHCKFASVTEFKQHCLTRLREPVVTVAKLSALSVGKLKHTSYKVNNGVARRSRNPVSPLRISLKKQEGSDEFQVVKVKKKTCQKRSRSESQPRAKKSTGTQKSDKGLGTESGPATGEKHTEESAYYEQPVFNPPVKRKGNAQPTLKFRGERVTKQGNTGNLDRNISCGLGYGQNVGRPVSGGLSATKRNSTVFESYALNEGINLPKMVSVFSAGTGDANMLKTSSTVAIVGSDKQNVNKTSILEKRNGLSFSLVPKTAGGTVREEQAMTNCAAEKEKQQKLNSLKIIDFEIFVRPKNYTENTSNSGRNGRNGRNLETNSLRIFEVPDGGEGIENGPGLENGQAKTVADDREEEIANEDKRPLVGKKRSPSRNSNSDENNAGDERNVGDKEDDPVESIDTDQTGNIKSACESGFGGYGCGGKEESCISRSPNGDTDEANATCLERGTSPLPHPEQQLRSFEEPSDHLEQENPCSILLGPLPDGEDSESSTFNVNCEDAYHSEPFAENNEPELQEDEGGDSLSSLPSEGSSLNEPPEDRLLPSEVPSRALAETMSQSFLHSFLNNPQTSQLNKPDGLEYMSLERLTQGRETRHGQGNFDIDTGEPSTPMEQLSQQVQRLPNPPMSLMSHHMQAPQIHPGLPKVPPQQQPGSFDPLAHVQPPLPPSLYQGYGLLSQTLPTQSSQQVPSGLPTLQQRPPMQAGGFPNIVPLPRARNRRPVKRCTRLPPPQAAPQKQRRLEATLSARSQATISPTAKMPSCIAFSTARKNNDANKVANVLASRGITVTPTSGIPGQPSPSNRSHQRANPVLNVGQGVPMTANNGSNRSGNNFAIPTQMRNSPMVNEDIERPERCATVDLTMDDDPSTSSQNRRASRTRYPCNQCRKVYASPAALENHKLTHRSAGALPFRCGKCSAAYPTAAGLQQHRQLCHKRKRPAPELGIPIVDVNHPGARDHLVQCGIYGFLPLSQLQSNSLGYFGIPIIQIDPTREMAMPNLNIFGTANVLVLGRMKWLADPQAR